MSVFQLHCFAESGNSYKAAMMLELCDLDWSPELIDFFNGETRSEKYRAVLNEQGEAPVLVHRHVSLSQSGVILNYLSEYTGKFCADDKTEEYEILRWLLFDNHKFTSYMATRRFLLTLMKQEDGEVTRFLEEKAKAALDVVNKHLSVRDFVAAEHMTIADISMSAYLFYGDELQLDLSGYSNINKWLDRIRDQSGWKGPYELMPRAQSVQSESI